MILAPHQQIKLIPKFHYFAPKNQGKSDANYSQAKRFCSGCAVARSVFCSFANVSQNATYQPYFANRHLFIQKYIAGTLLLYLRPRFQIALCARLLYMELGSYCRRSRSWYWSIVCVHLFWQNIHMQIFVKCLLCGTFPLWYDVFPGGLSWKQVCG